MTAVEATIEPAIPPRIIDFAECPAALDDDGRAGRAEVIALRAHVMLTQLMAENRALRVVQSVCDSCGGQPCVNPSFCAGCRRADEVRQAPKPASKSRPTPSTTVEAIKQAVRDRGVAALDEPAAEQRLRSCDVTALAEIDRWLSEKGLSR